MRSALTVSLVMGGLLACSRGVTGGGANGTGTQPGPDPTFEVAADTLAKPASLVRRLAEAADGYRDGNNRFVVADRRFPHTVRGVFLTQDTARVEATRAGSDYGVFGPFRTLDDPVDAVSRPEERVAEVIVVYRNGERRQYGADSVDAIFWGLAAFDKFIAPYLTSVFGAAYAAKQREEYRRGESEWVRSEQVAHKRASF